jgi:beta-N-acetylhexosaminidase
MHGMREAGMAATAKHFPGHGAVVADSHLSLPLDRRPLVDLTRDLTPYRRLIANGLPAVMMAHILFPAVDPDPSSLSGLWIRDVLRGELRFQGVVFTDDLSMKGAAAYGDIVTRARQALAAGCDMLPVCNHRPNRSRPPACAWCACTAAPGPPPTPPLRRCPSGRTPGTFWRACPPPRP